MPSAAVCVNEAGLILKSIPLNESPKEVIESTQKLC